MLSHALAYVMPMHTGGHLVCPFDLACVMPAGLVHGVQVVLGHGFDGHMLCTDVNLFSDV